MNSMSSDIAITGKGASCTGSAQLRILYMEDDLGLARLLKKRLAGHGYLVDLVPDGAQGLAQIEKTGYQAVLVDYNMPVVCGMDVVRALVQREQPIPVIMVTGNGDEKVAVEAMKLGAMDYLVKDLELRYLDLLPMVLEKVLMGHRLAQERARALDSIRESELHYRKLVELSPDGIIICCSARIEFANPAALRLLGDEGGEHVLGQMILGFLHPESAHIWARFEVAEAGGGKMPWLEARFVRLDYTELTVEVSGTPFPYRGRQAVQLIFRDIMARVEAKQLMERMAYYDQLTRLPNRALFFDRLGVNLAQAKRYDFSFALLYIDLDGFKQVNDTRGHDQGDALLVQVAARLERCCRDSDTVSRLGGDEFAVLMPRVNGPEDSAVVAERIIAALSEAFDLRGEQCQIGGSIGISLFPSDAGDADTLLNRADSAMYEAKQRGGNRFLYYGR
jgi:diguanylate cyclase (GGDEF)-like protein/PAS domain S-box-containing protein